MTPGEARQKTLEAVTPVLAGCGATDPQSSAGVSAALVTLAVTVACGSHGMSFENSRDIISQASEAMIEVIRRHQRRKLTGGTP